MPELSGFVRILIIKNHQQKQRTQPAEVEHVEKFQSDFKTSLNYLQTMINQNKEKKNKRTRRRYRKETPSPQGHKKDIPVNTTPFDKVQPAADSVLKTTGLADVLKPKPDPPYGCLKNGRKPTYSQYMGTVKRPRRPRHDKVVLPPKPPPTKEVLERKSKLQNLKDTLATPKQDRAVTLLSKKRTIKIFKLGKRGRRVGVLIKSGKTRKKIRQEQRVLHDKCLSDVKKYLRKHNLIKAGTSAPENVLRKLYEDSYLAGDIYNRNIDTLLHNYMQNNKPNESM